MVPVQFLLMIQFAEPKHTHPLSQRINEELSGKAYKPPPGAAIPRESMRLRITEEKALIQWNTTSCSITVEELSNQEYSIDLIGSFLDRIDEVARIDQMSMRRFGVYWILPTPNHDFSSLERVYRATMITQNEISDTAYDSSVILDIGAAERTLHHQSGPMAPEQLKHDYLRFKSDNVPKSFLFLETAIMDLNVVKYSNKDMVEFMRKSRNDCISHSRLFEKVWEGRL